MTMDRPKSEPILSAPNNGSLPHQPCAECGKPIHDRFLLRALDMYWHEDCLKCGCCDCRLGEVGSTLYIKSDLMLCKRDYLRLFGNTGLCAACNKVIPAFEMVMRARSNVYHLECFACQQCNHRFCVGDRFYLCENKILCEYDYEERLVFASIGNHPMLKRHANNMSAASQQQQSTQNHPNIGPNGHGVHHQSGGSSQPVSPAFNSKMDDPNNNNNNNNNLTKSSNIHHHGALASGGSMF